MSRSTGRVRAAVDRLPVVDAGVALAAGVAAVAGSYAAAGFTPSFVVAPVSTTATRLTPGIVIAWAIQTLGSLGQQLVLVGAAVATVVLFALVAAIGRVAGERFGRPAAGTLATGLAAAALAWALAPAAVPALAAGVGAGVVVGLADAGVPGRRVGSGRADTDDGPDGGTGATARRRVLRAAAGAVAVLGIGGVLGARPRGSGGGSESRSGSGTEPTARRDASESTPQSGDGDDGGAGSEDGGTETSGPEPVAPAELLEVARERSFDVDGLEGLVSDGFYQVDINSVDPDPTAEDWSLRVTGAVDSELTVTYDELTAMPAEHRFVSLRCVGEGLNGKKMDTALWTGVPVMDVIESAGIPDTCCVMLRAVDDYYEEFPLSALRSGFLAYGMNGEPLPRGHGRPVRALIPGHWGEINVKWLTEVEILDQPAKGYWEKRGWHGTGPVNTVAKLHAVNRLGNGRIEVAGHAYAGTRGIERVEVSVDGGSTWSEADLSPALPGATAADETDRAAAASGTAEDAWRMWRHEYEADGAHEVVVRAVDGTGTLQPRQKANAYPSGASGWVSRRIRP